VGDSGEGEARCDSLTVIEMQRNTQIDMSLFAMLPSWKKTVFV
jgi:hypothetical protein